MKKNTLNPYYNESFSFEIPLEQMQVGQGSSFRNLSTKCSKLKFWLVIVQHKYATPGKWTSWKVVSFEFFRFSFFFFILLWLIVIRLVTASSSCSFFMTCFFLLLLHLQNQSHYWLKMIKCYFSKNTPALINPPTTFISVYCLCTFYKNYSCLSGRFNGSHQEPFGFAKVRKYCHHWENTSQPLLQPVPATGQRNDLTHTLLLNTACFSRSV